MSNHLATVRPDTAYRATRRYRLTCRCGWDGGTIVGTAAAARALRAHPCPAHLAGPYAEPEERSR